MSKILRADFETRSAADLRKVGLDVYAQDPTTDILCLGYAFDDEPIQLWKRGEPLPARVAEHVRAGGAFSAFNANFELVIWNEIGAKRLGWPRLTAAQTACTMAEAYAMSLPGSLESCSAALGLAEGKDMAGGRLMLQMSKPKTAEPLTWWEDEERLERLHAYCRNDVRVEREVSKRIRRLSPYEHKVWQLDYEINRRGVAVDRPKVEAAIRLIDSEKKRLDAEMRLLTNNAVAACSAVQQIKDYLEFFGVTSDGMDKAAVADHLKADLHPTARRILELRQEAGKASAAKFEALSVGVGSDHRLRGCYQYSGANTRRWAGRRVQLHNLPRGNLKPDEVEELISYLGAKGDRDLIEMMFGSPMGALAGALRGFLVAAPGHELLGADYSAIEGRVLAWLAGQEDALGVYRRKEDPYCAEASSIFGVPVTKKDADKRQIGKVATLALGFGGGVGAFQNMARAYGVKMEPAFQNLSARVSADQKDRAEKNLALNGYRFEISPEEFLASDYTKILWREKNAEIVKYWYSLEEMAIEATRNPGQIFRTPTYLPKVAFKKSGSFLWCHLPGGGLLCYPYPEIKQGETPWGEMKESFSYMSEDGASRKWQRFTTYGGSLAENITQAVARDLLADAMLRLDAKGYKIAMHTHDEIVCEMPTGLSALSDMVAVMTTNPAWALTLPIAAEGFTAKRYRK